MIARQSIKAYKFRSISQLNFIEDILLKKRLYCADWANLNDPMEGFFLPDKEQKNKVNEIITEKKEKRICSLSKTANSFLLWAHYASSFNGVAIEVTFSEIENNKCDEVKIKEIKYRENPCFICSESKDFSYDVADKAAEIILSSKYKEWEYEKEIRILTRRKEYFENVNITKVFIGHNVSEDNYRRLKEICNDQKIPIGKTYIDENGLNFIDISN